MENHVSQQLGPIHQTVIVSVVGVEYRHINSMAYSLSKSVVLDLYLEQK